MYVPMVDSINRFEVRCVVPRDFIPLTSASRRVPLCSSDRATCFEFQVLGYRAQGLGLMVDGLGLEV